MSWINTVARHIRRTSACVLSGFVILHAAPAAAAFVRDARVPGGVAVIALPEAAEKSPPEVFVGTQPIAVARHDNRWWALYGIALDQRPGSVVAVDIRGASGNYRSTITIQDKAYPTERLRITDQRKVEPLADDLVRIAQETPRIRALKTTFSPGVAQANFDRPSAAALSSRFGLRRFFNDQERKPHAGLDMRARTGDPITAPAEGIVLDASDYFFNGNTVFLDHGQGLITAYMHLSRFHVQPGQTVKRGDLIGEAGATGRATGPHLHWMVFLNGTAVDPELFIDEASSPKANRP